MKSGQLELFDAEPAVGELWDVWGNIVFVTNVGWTDEFGHHLPNCIQYIRLGAARYDCCGRFWDVDYTIPEGWKQGDRAYETRSHCDKVYFKPWNGRGVFFCSKDGLRAAKLINRWIEESHKNKYGKRSKIWETYAALEKLFQKQVAPEGFR